MGEPDQAQNYLDASLELFNAIGNRPLFARTLLLQADVAASRQQNGESIVLARASLEEFHEIEDSDGIASAIEAIAISHFRTENDPAHFLRLASAAAELRRNIKLRISPARSEVLEILTGKARKSLGRAAADSAATQGKTMPLSEAVRIAMSGDQASGTVERHTLTDPRKPLAA